MAYGRERSAAIGTPTKYRQFSFNKGVRTYLAGQDSTVAAGRNAVTDYNHLTASLQSAGSGGKYLSTYNKDKYLTALAFLRNKAQATAESKYAEYMEGVANPKFASKMTPGQSFLRAPTE